MALFELIQHTEPETEGNVRMTFKDAVMDDVDDIFFDFTEHAELHKVDGKEVPVIIEEDRLKDHSAHWEAGAKQNFDTGLYTDSIVLYIRISDYGAKPKVGKVLVMDEGTGHKRTYTVARCTEEDGVYRMTLMRTRQ